MIVKSVVTWIPINHVNCLADRSSIEPASAGYPASFCNFTSI